MWWFPGGARYRGKPLTGYWTVVQYRTRRMLGYCRKNAVDFTDPNAGAQLSVAER
jgi:hypothetical protein